ncbi:MAG: hydrolase [Dehalococcoidales bacterium]|nr:hydrolase [Dehalococcoidales bacterium]
MLKTENTVLVIIDIQGKLWNVMYEKETLLENARKLSSGARVLGVPVILTEQNPRGLGPTLPELMECLPGITPLPKFSFSCYRDSGFQQTLVNLKRKQVIICGIEAHICVYQTTLELLSSGYEVHVAADVVSSRAVRNREITLSRLQSEGARLTVSEMALYELLETAENPAFKEMLKVIK